MEIENLAGVWPNVAINPATGKTYEAEHIDTREELEADLREWIDIATYKAFTPRRMLEVMHHWLYRQAEITEREFWEGYSNGNQWEIYQFEKKCNELQDEIQYLRKVCQTQADSFAAIENENTFLRSKLNRIRELAERLQDA